MPHDSDVTDKELEQSFGIESGRYRNPESGEFHDGSPPTDYDSEVDRFRANNGRFKNRSKDLGMGEDFDAPEEDARNSFDAEEMEGEMKREVDQDERDAAILMDGLGFEDGGF